MTTCGPVGFEMARLAPRTTTCRMQRPQHCWACWECWFSTSVQPPYRVELVIAGTVRPPDPGLEVSPYWIIQVSLKDVLGSVEARRCDVRQAHRDLFDHQSSWKSSTVDTLLSRCSVRPPDILVLAVRSTIFAILTWQVVSRQGLTIVVQP